MASSPQTTMIVKPPHQMQRWICGAIACLLPLVAIFLSPARADTALVYIGMLPAIVALTISPRVALATAASTGAAVFIGLLLSTNPWAAAAFMVLLGLGVAWSYQRGWQAAATYVASQGALAAVSAPHAKILNEVTVSPVVSAAVVAGFVLFGGLWVAIAGYFLLPDLPKHPKESPTSSELRVFAVILCLMLGVGTVLIMTYSSTSNGWWVLLTALVVLEPGHQHTMRRALERSGGTIVGGGLAALAVIFINNPQLISTLGLLAAIASAVTYIKAPYWVFSMTLTMALVFLVTPVGRVLHGDLERVLFTVLAALLVVALSAVAHKIQRRLGRAQ
ncbi:hypothetical protein JOF28_000210 [Leucobacter exalbidus]|uniref:Integral membrane bound transporter domain-containing protein n=1 Tax=Leucobacter exalbidus TaxID=662960 RepID=A0A940T2N2_9MICO|nr:FUSC family protein [Leucobacter exalbidus]MBP1324978.1 hypothetical protein [Leucobacter exalbidus]